MRRKTEISTNTTDEMNPIDSRKNSSLANKWLFSAKNWFFIFLVILLAAFFVILLFRRFNQASKNSDTIFVPTEPSGVGRFTNQDAPEIIDHINQHCIYERGSISAEPFSYLRFCKIREGAYQQDCSTDDLVNVYCSNPEVIPGTQPEDCQRQFIAGGFFKKSFSFFSNCAKGLYPPKSTRDNLWEHQHVEPGATSYSSTSAEGFSLTRRY